MSTASFSAPVRRFVWKEYRTLRGLWLAVLVLALLLFWLCGLVVTPGSDPLAWRLYVALAASSLYAAGAASILFSMEHEEQTYDFLRGLPTTWWPAFAGKLLLATVSSVALAAALSLIALATGGFRVPVDFSAPQALGIYGTAVFEMIAWGTLFSLLIKRPLAAAIATLVVAVFVVNVVVNTTSGSLTASSDPAAYVSAVPARLAIVGAVMALSVAIARNWLTVRERAPSKAEVGLLHQLATRAGRQSVKTSANAIPAARTRSGMLGRLLWQTWRESRWMLLLPIALGGACFVLAYFFASLGQAGGVQVGMFLGVAAMFFAPALYGALAFAADQRRGQVSFLAEHAAAPRYVWLARHLVWLGALVMVSVLLVSRTVNLLCSTWGWNPLNHIEFPLFVWQAAWVANGIALLMYGLIAAYSIGQACSMFVRSNVLAMFLALLLAVVLSGWTVALFVWRLQGWLLLAPVAAGLMGATWLRAPDWIAGRTGWRAWVTPALVIIAELAFLGLALPEARLNQIPRGRTLLSEVVKETVAAASATPMPSAKEARVAAEETAQMYLKAARMLDAPLADDPLEPWEAPKFGLIGIEEERIPADQFDAYRAAKEKSQEMINDQREAAIKLAIEASKRPTCQFEFPDDGDYEHPSIPSSRYASVYLPYRANGSSELKQLDALLSVLATRNLIGLPTTSEHRFDELLAALRMSAHMRQGQRSAIFLEQLAADQFILRQIGEWARSKDTTNEERRAAIAALQEQFKIRPESSPAAAFPADDHAIREVIEGRELPVILRGKDPRRMNQLAYVANELPWERQRALDALTLISNQNISDAFNLASFLQTRATRDNGHAWLQRWLQPNSAPPAWLRQQPAAATSYLASLEYRARVPVDALLRMFCDTVTRQNAVLIEIAVSMYREDQNNELPATLRVLVPKYMEYEPLDPYAMQPFGYVPKGLDAPVIENSRLDRPIIGAQVPFFWSVGVNNVRLQQVTLDPNSPASSRPYAFLPADQADNDYIPDAAELVFLLGEGTPR